MHRDYKPPTAYTFARGSEQRCSPRQGVAGLAPTSLSGWGLTGIMSDVLYPMLDKKVKSPHHPFFPFSQPIGGERGMTRLEQIRKQRGIPYYVLARQANASSSTLRLWEKYGLVPKRRDVIERVARALGVEPEELLEDSEEVSEA